MAENRVLAAVAYVFGWISGLIVFLVSKEDRFARFHGMQAILFNIACVVIAVALSIVIAILAIIVGVAGAALKLGAVAGIIAMLLWLVLLVYALASLVLLLWTIWQAYNGKTYKMPLIGGLAEKWSQ
jgi:uncharacterized membrane protein